MNKNAEKWLQALESGDYPQSTHCLKDKDGYCCLGVACDIFMKETGEGSWEQHKESTPQESLEVFVLDGEVESGVLTSRVREWLGLYDECGASKDNPHGNASCTNMNDHGASFQHIAAILRKNEESYFKEI